MLRVRHTGGVDYVCLDRNAGGLWSQQAEWDRRRVGGVFSLGPVASGGCRGWLPGRAHKSRLRWRARRTPRDWAVEQRGGTCVLEDCLEKGGGSLSQRAELGGSGKHSSFKNLKNS